MNEKVLTFYLGDNLFGIDIKYVKEINRNVDFTYIPGVDKYIEGLLNLRGQIITLFNIAKLINLKNVDEKREKNPCIILKNKEREYDRIGFLIDKPCDVVDLKKFQLQDLPENIEANFRKFIKAIVKLEKESLLLLDMSKIAKHL